MAGIVAKCCSWVDKFFCSQLWTNCPCLYLRTVSVFEIICTFSSSVSTSIDILIPVYKMHFLRKVYSVLCKKNVVLTFLFVCLVRC